MKRQWGVILLCLFFIGGCKQTSDVNQENLEAKKPIVLLNELQSIEADLFGDGRKSRIDLSAQVDENGNPLAWMLKVDGVDSIKFPSEPGTFGARAEMKLEDMDGNGKPEVLIFRYSTGSGGATGLNIYNPSDNWKKLFAIETEAALGSSNGPSAARYEVKYLGNYQVSFKDNQSGLNATIPLDHQKVETMYGDRVEQKLMAISTWVDPISDYIIEDQDGDGVKEIVAVQRIIGTAHPDTIALLKSTYKLLDGEYRADSEAVYDTVDGKLIAKNVIRPKWEVVSRTQRVLGTIAGMKIDGNTIKAMDLKVTQNVQPPNNPVDYDFVGQTLHLTMDEELSNAGYFTGNWQQGASFLVNFAQVLIPPQVEAVLGTNFATIYYEKNGKFYDTQGNIFDLSAEKEGIQDTPIDESNIQQEVIYSVPEDDFNKSGTQIPYYQKGETLFLPDLVFKQFDEGHQPWLSSPVEVVLVNCFNFIGGDLAALQNQASHSEKKIVIDNQTIITQISGDEHTTKVQLNVPEKKKYEITLQAPKGTGVLFIKEIVLYSEKQK